MYFDREAHLDRAQQVKRNLDVIREQMRPRVYATKDGNIQIWEHFQEGYLIEESLIGCFYKDLSKESPEKRGLIFLGYL